MWKQIHSVFVFAYSTRKSRQLRKFTQRTMWFDKITSGLCSQKSLSVEKFVTIRKLFHFQSTCRAQISNDFVRFAKLFLCNAKQKFPLEVRQNRSARSPGRLYFRLRDEHHSNFYNETILREIRDETVCDTTFNIMWKGKKSFWLIFGLC